MRPLLLLLAACSAKPQGADTSAGGGPDLTDDSGGPVDSGDDGSDPAYDPWAAIDPDHCEDAPGFESLAGATAYFIGEYSRSGGALSGVETAAYYATAEWAAAGGADCLVVWSVSGSEGSCSGGCAFTMEVQATLDTAATTCPTALWAGSEGWSATYAVALGAEGAATFSFEGSSSTFAEGVASATSVTFLTPPACEWF
jgi:hypothetical protein